MNELRHVICIERNVDCLDESCCARIVTTARLSLLSLVLLFLSGGAALGANFMLDPGTRLETPIPSDLYMAGGWLEMDTSIDGDLRSASGSIDLSGRLNGNGLIAAGLVDIRGLIEGDLLILGGLVDIDTSVGQDLSVAAGRLTVSEASHIAGNAYMGAGRVDLGGRIGGNVRIAAGEVVVRGQIAGDVHIDAATLTLEPSTRIAGTLYHRTVEDPLIANPGGVQRVVVLDRAEPSKPAAPASSWRLVTIWVALLILFSALFFFFPRWTVRAAAQIRSRWWLAFPVGFAALFATPILFAILIVTVVGVPLALILAGSIVLVVAAGLPSLAFCLARLASRLASPGHQDRWLALIALTGVALFLFLLLGQIPLVGGLLVGLLTLTGAGGLLLALWESYHLARS
ncbi:MAG: hypothetical protein ACFB6S_17335 [Geminicoccaceae bacterium]